MKSTSYRIVCDLYTGNREIKTEMKKGFVQIVQKQNIVGLTVLMDHEGDKVKVKAGQKVYISEDALQDLNFGKKSFSCKEVLEKEFALVEEAQVIFFG